MFFLLKKEKCSICNLNETRKKLLDGYVCSRCSSGTEKYISNGLKNLTIEKFGDILKIKKSDDEKRSKFKATLKINSTPFIYFDDNIECILIKNILGIEEIIDYKDIISFETIEDGETIIKSNGLGRAVVGGVLFGGAGAIVGAMTGSKKTNATIKNLKIKLVTRLDYASYREIIFIKSETKKESFKYKIAIDECNKTGAKLTQVLDKQN